MTIDISALVSQSITRSIVDEGGAELTADQIAVIQDVYGSGYVRGFLTLLSEQSAGPPSGKTMLYEYGGNISDVPAYKYVAAKINADPSGYEIADTDQFKYMKENLITFVDIKNTINKDLADAGLPLLKGDQLDSVSIEPLWRYVSGNVAANAQFMNTTAGPDLSQYSILVQNEVPAAVANAVPINTEAASAYDLPSTDLVTKLIGVTGTENPTLVDTNDETVAVRSPGDILSSDITAADALSAAPSLTPEVKQALATANEDWAGLNNVANSISEVTGTEGSVVLGTVLGGAMKGLAAVGGAMMAYDIINSGIQAEKQAKDGNFSDALLTIENLAARVTLGLIGAEDGALVGAAGGAALGLVFGSAAVGGAIGGIIGAAALAMVGVSVSSEMVSIINGAIVSSLSTLENTLVSMGASMTDVAHYLGNETPAWAGSFSSALQKYSAPDYYEPLVFDLGSGIQTTTLDNGTYFDNKNNAFAEQTAWVGSNTGILVNDPTGGPITNGSQMFGTSTSLSGGGYAVDGFAALAALDSNHDGVINSSDTDWSDLRIWVDANGNGVVDSGEIETLPAAGIASISLSTANTDTVDVNGNEIGKTAAYTKTGGGTAEVADVYFKTNPMFTVPDTILDLTDDIANLPNVHGYGAVADLQQTIQAQANASDTTLEGYVSSFVSATDDATRNTLVDEIIYQWTGVEGVSGGSRGSYFDARQLAALEKYTGGTFVDPYLGGSNPGQQSVVILTATYQQLHDWVLANLESQTDLASLFNDPQLSLDSTTFNAYWDFSAAETEIISDISANRATGLTTLSDFNQALHALGLDSGEGYNTFRNDLVSLGTDVADAFLYNGTVVYSTVANDVITAWRGNQTVIAGQGGSDTLSGAGR